jgi:hypothetical protein
MDKENRPAYYGGNDNPYEAIKIIEYYELNFNIGNVVKYILRAGLKTPDKIEDLKKAIWYLGREIENLERLENEWFEVREIRVIVLKFRKT